MQQSATLSSATNSLIVEKKVIRLSSLAPLTSCRRKVPHPWPDLPMASGAGTGCMVGGHIVGGTCLPPVRVL